MIGADRVESLISASPSETTEKAGKTRSKPRSRDNGNTNLHGHEKSGGGSGTVFSCSVQYRGISVFVFHLTGMMLFFAGAFLLIYAMFLPAAFVLSMAPTFEGDRPQGGYRCSPYHICKGGHYAGHYNCFQHFFHAVPDFSGCQFFIIAFWWCSRASIQAGAICSACFPLHDDGAARHGRLYHAPPADVPVPPAPQAQPDDACGGQGQ